MTAANKRNRWHENYISLESAISHVTFLKDHLEENVESKEDHDSK